MVFQYPTNEAVKRLLFQLEIYTYVENQLADIQTYIPLANDWKTFSLKIIPILSMSAAGVEECFRLAVFNEAVDEDKLKKFKNFNVSKFNTQKRAESRDFGFSQAFHLLNEISNRKLSAMQVPVSLENTDPIRPFRENEDGSNNLPGWYNDWNSIKHSIYENVEKATINNAINAIAAFNLIFFIAQHEIERAFYHVSPEITKPKKELYDGKGTLLSMEEGFKPWYECGQYFTTMGVVSLPLNIVGLKPGSRFFLPWSIG